MSTLINPRKVHSDIEKKITNWVRTNLTDRKPNGRPKKSPFAVIGTELKHSHHFPHVIIQLVDMPDELFAMNSKSRIKFPYVQITMQDSAKEPLNHLKDELLYKLADARDTFLAWGLNRCKVRSEGHMPFNDKLKVHGYFIQYEFLYFHMIS